MTAPVLLPPATVGVIGGGQLGMMLVREAQRMGYRTAVWDADPSCPASRLADERIIAPFDDRVAAERLADRTDVVTYEFENIDPETVRWIEGRRPLAPGSAILSVSRHRIEEKTELARRGFPVPRFAAAPTAAALPGALDTIGLPAVVKTATAGYDGKGQSVLRTTTDRARFLASAPAGEFIVEELVSLRCELSAIVARSADGTTRSFPVPVNEHRENILHRSTVPGGVPARVEEDAAALGQAVIGSFALTGILCVELFLAADGRLLVNELAPRPHNSGHYSLDACDCSQFEMLLRAACGLPLPVPRLLSPCAMVNLLGKHLSPGTAERLLAVPGAKLHLYGKARSEPRRKMGHVTLLAGAMTELQQRVRAVCGIIGEPESPPDVRPAAVRTR